MISSLKSRFNIFNRRALFVTAGRARVYHWNNGVLDGIYTFDTSEQGLNLFDDYLHENSEDPVYILTDIAEEEFRLDSIPHVMGGDRKSLIERRKIKLFRNIKYSYSEVQGRDTEGRRDDRILFTALAEDEAIQPWLARLESGKIPVAGIYSIATLSKNLLKNLGHDAGPALIVSLQRNAGLRISFFQNGNLKFSRLVRLPRYGTEPYTPIIANEIDKMLRYLRSMRQLGQESLMQVYLLADDTLLEELKKDCQDKAGISYNWINIGELATKLGYRTDFIDPFSESIFVYILLKNRSKNIYAHPDETRYYSLQRLQNFLLGSSLFLLLGTFIWSALAFVDGITLKQETISTKAKTQFYTERYEIARERLPELPVEPADLKTAVEITDSMAQYKASPLPMMQTLSHGLQNSSEIRIDSIKWQASMDPNANPGSNKDSDADGAELSKTDDYIYYQIARINGSLSPFDGNYRGAIDLVNRLAQDIRAQPDIYNVEILILPLNVSPEAKLQGSGESVDGEAGFSLRIVQGISGEA